MALPFKPEIAKMRAAVNELQAKIKEELAEETEASCALLTITEALDKIEGELFLLAYVGGIRIERSDFPASVERDIANRPYGATAKSSLDMPPATNTPPPEKLCGLLKAFLAEPPGPADEKRPRA